MYVYLSVFMFYVDAYSGPFTLPHWDSILNIELYDSAGDYNINEEIAKVLMEGTGCNGWFVHGSNYTLMNDHSCYSIMYCAVCRLRERVVTYIRMYIDAVVCGIQQ